MELNYFLNIILLFIIKKFPKERKIKIITLGKSIMKVLRTYKRLNVVF